jgi:hypothetical protein
LEKFFGKPIVAKAAANDLQFFDGFQIFDLGRKWSRPELGVSA